MLRVLPFGNILLVMLVLTLFLCYVALLVHVYGVRTGFGILWQMDMPHFRGDWLNIWKFRELFKIWELLVCLIATQGRM